jgi:MoaA/NifB/PqqE/SkfB family radical SAM enzyme
MRTSEYDFTKIPFDRIVKLGQISMLYNDLFTVSWLLGRYCNYRCSYCWTHGRSEKKDHRPIELCLKTIDSIKEQARSRGFNKFHFSLSGGEPTLHPGYLGIMKYLLNDVHADYTSVHMTTNLSRNLPWLDRYAEIAKQFDRASVTASFHGEYINTEHKLQTFITKLLFLQHNYINVTVNMVMVPERFDELYNIASKFYDNGINATLKPQSDPHANHVVEGYTQEQLDILHNGMPQQNEGKQLMQVELVDDENEIWYMDQAERFNAFNFNCFKDWECSSGFRSIIIREPCGSIKRSYSCADEPLGNIQTGFKLYDKPEPCKSPSCVSSADSKIPKRKSGIELPLFPGDKTYEL